MDVLASCSMAATFIYVIVDTGDVLGIVTIPIT